jgi:hypothetical protein
MSHPVQRFRAGVLRNSSLALPALVACESSPHQILRRARTQTPTTDFDTPISVACLTEGLAADGTDTASGPA